MKQSRFYYQPSPIFSTIDWCWTFVILLTGIIFWLEVTHFQWITMGFFIAFFIVAGLELLNRRILIDRNELVVKDMFGREWRRFNFRDGDLNLAFTRHTLVIHAHNQTRQFSLRVQDVKRIKEIVRRH